MKSKLSVIALAFLLGLPLASSFAQIGISVAIAPPAIPIYEQPYCPAEGYIWTPGYWAYADSDYYWVPGVWVEPPRPRLLWTPGYWGYDGSNYSFNEGYWGPSVGFYGGINYGFGYTGNGYYGGEWVGDSFRYNRAVTRVNTAVIQNTYVNKQFATNATASLASFNGPGGVTAKASEKELALAKADRIQATSAQLAQVEAAKGNPALHLANNKGKPKADAIKALANSSGTQSVGGVTKGGNDKAVTGKMTNGAATGNSAFGHKQGDALTRTKGSQNNAYGKARSASVHSSHVAKTTYGKSSHVSNKAAFTSRGGGSGKAKGGPGKGAKGEKEH